MINIANTYKAYSEVYSFLNVLGTRYISKIPKSVYSIIEEKRDKSYNPSYSINQEVNDKTFSKEALALIVALNLQYFCDDVNTKKELKQKYLENTKKENEKYSYDNMFKNNSSATTESKAQSSAENIKIEETQLIEYKEPKWYTKLFEKILSIFRVSKNR